MAIAFARLEYVKRSAGKNACCKAAYNKRDTIKDEKTGIVYSFKNRGGNVHHEIMLPEGASVKFLDAEVLWNTVEKSENKKNSQVAKELILALPGDKIIRHEDRLELTRRFCQEFFVDKGLIVQIDIHAPHKEIDKNFSDEIDEDLHEKIDKNWHAHILVITRLLLADGETLSPTKARHLDAQVRKGFVVEGELWGKIWKELQNAYFKEMGYDLRVDEVGIIAQKHLGPVRMRRHMNERQQELDLLKEANEEVSLVPEHILKHFAKTHSVFGEKEIDAYLEKHVSDDKKRDEVKQEVLECEELVPLYGRESLEVEVSQPLEGSETVEDNEKKSIFYTTKKVREEEERILRHAYRVQEKGALVIYGGNVSKEFKFTKEQQEAFQYVLEGDSGIKIIEGRAGTGKSYLMQEIREAYEREGVSVIGLAPTHLVTKDLEKGGFKGTYTVQRFLFQYINSRIKVPSRSLFMVDEAGMVPNPALGELLKVARETSSKVIFFGDQRQLHAIGRGGLFSHLVDTFGSSELRSVRRQKISWQKDISEQFSQGNVKEALTILRDHQGIFWDSTKEESMSRLIEDWLRGEEADYERELKGEKRSSSQKIRMILAHPNIDVDVINQAIHRARQGAGRVDREEFLVDGDRGRIGFSVGDRIQFGSTDKILNIYAGGFGTLIKASLDEFVVISDLGGKIIFNPGEYSGLRLGYASTIYKAQGKTVSDAYILHSPRINKHLGYVALTRQTKNLRFYVTYKETKSFWHLQRQLTEEDLKRCSLEFKTKEDLLQEKNLETPTFIQKHFRNRYEEIKTRIRDLEHQNVEFYRVPLKEEKLLRDVIQQDVREKWNQEEAEEKAFMKTQEKEGKILSSETGERSIENTAENYSFKKPSYDKDKIYEALLKDVRGFGEHLLGGWDAKLSTSQQLCFRSPKEYKIYLNIKTGLWKDFINDEGGNLFKLITWKRGGNFKDALEYAARYTGEGGRDSSLQDPKGRDPQRLDFSGRSPANQGSWSRDPQQEIKDTQELELKIQKTKNLYKRSEPVAGTLAERYLREHRGIKGDLPQDLRFTDSFYNTELKENIPALVAFTRNREGDLRAFQVTYLDFSTASKAKVETPKKTHGNVSGSYVEIQKEKGPIYMAEGVETALSLKEAGMKGTILASLGIQNIKYYDERGFEEEHNNRGQVLILAADHDSRNSKTAAVIEKASTLLKEKGYTVQIIQPEIEGQDFNDVLQKEGRERVYEYFKEVHVPLFSAERKETGEELYDAHSLSREYSQETREVSDAKSVQKVSRSLKEKGFKNLSFDSLHKEYVGSLRSNCEAQVGKDYKKYLPEIKEIAERASQMSLMKGQIVEGEERTLLFARAQYEVRRAKELEEKAISKQEDFSESWMNDRLISQVRASIEGSLYQEARSQKEILDKKDFKTIHQEGKSAFEKTIQKLEVHEENYIKQGLSKEEASFIAKVQVFHEVSYGKEIDSHHLSTFLHLVRSGYVRAQLYTHLYHEKAQEVDSSSRVQAQREIDKDISQNMERMAKYRVFGEIKEILPRVLCTSQEISSKEMQKIQEKVENSFNKDHRAYGIRQEKEEKVVHHEREAHAQKNQAISLQKEREKGFER